MFTNVRVLSHHEPVFLDGLGEEPMRRFRRAVQGRLADAEHQDRLQAPASSNNPAKAGNANVYLDGVAKATASVRILNQSLLAASLKVARARMGYAQDRDPERVARIRPDIYALPWTGLRWPGPAWCPARLSTTATSSRPSWHD